MAVVSVSQNSSDQQAAFQLSEWASRQSGYPIRVVLVDSYDEVLLGLEDFSVHAAWLPPSTYLIAERKQLVSVAALINQFGVYMIGVQFLANVDGGFTTYFNPQDNSSSAPASQALSQFRGMRPCFTEPTSPSGYIVPGGILLEAGVAFLEPVAAQTTSTVIRALYYPGICDFGATYAISGDPRTASNLQDLPDLLDRVVVLWQSEPVIPNLNLSIHQKLPREMREAMARAFLEANSDAIGLELISDALNYEVQGLRPATDADYERLRQLVQITGANLRESMGR
jgi:phosphonate transport system substrate-binding protein